MYQLAGFDEAAAKKGVEVVMDVETRLAKAFRSRTELRNPHANYNKMSLEELKKNYPTFDWDAYLSALDLKRCARSYRRSARFSEGCCRNSGYSSS